MQKLRNLYQIRSHNSNLIPWVAADRRGCQRYVHTPASLPTKTTLKCKSVQLPRAICINTGAQNQKVVYQVSLLLVKALRWPLPYRSRQDGQVFGLVFAGDHQLNRLKSAKIELKREVYHISVCFLIKTRTSRLLRTFPQPTNSLTNSLFQS